MSEHQFFERVLARLKAVPYTELPVVADATHVSISHLRKIRYSEVRNPGVQTVQALHDYFTNLDSLGTADTVAPDSGSLDQSLPASPR